MNASERMSNMLIFYFPALVLLYLLCSLRAILFVQTLRSTRELNKHGVKGHRRTCTGFVDCQNCFVSPSLSAGVNHVFIVYFYYYWHVSKLLEEAEREFNGSLSEIKALLLDVIQTKVGEPRLHISIASSMNVNPIYVHASSVFFSAFSFFVSNPSPAPVLSWLSGDSVDLHGWPETCQWGLYTSWNPTPPASYLPPLFVCTHLHVWHKYCTHTHTLHIPYTYNTHTWLQVTMMLLKRAMVSRATPHSLIVSPLSTDFRKKKRRRRQSWGHQIAPAFASPSAPTLPPEYSPIGFGHCRSLLLLWQVYFFLLCFARRLSGSVASELIRQFNEGGRRGWEKSVWVKDWWNVPTVC